MSLGVGLGNAVVQQWFGSSSEVRRASLLGGTARAGRAVGQARERVREESQRSIMEADSLTQMSELEQKKEGIQRGRQPRVRC